jgi:outer membrane receptor for ferrienterochelin and colicins
MIGSYQLPFRKRCFRFRKRTFQDSRYGTTSYIANQDWFSTVTWDKKIGNDLPWSCHRTIITVIHNGFKTGDNNPEKTWLPGIFLFKTKSRSPNLQAITGNALRLQLVSEHLCKIAYKWN